MVQPCGHCTHALSPLWQPKAVGEPAMSDRLQIRWSIAADLDEVLDIERRCFRRNAWKLKDFKAFSNQRNGVMRVSELYDRVVGYICYEIYDTRINIVNLAVHPEDQRIGIGACMVNSVTEKLLEENSRHKRVTVEICEENLPAQLFFKTLGFKYAKTLEGYYPNNPEVDAYLFSIESPEICVT